MSITATPTVEASNVPPRVRLNVSATAGETSTTVVRNNPDGTTSPVRTGDGNPLPISGGVALAYDYEAPFGVGVSYTTLESPTIVSVQVTVAITDIWLIHPGVPALSMPVKLRPGSLVQETLSVRQGVFWPMGRSTPVVITDGSRKKTQSTLIVSLETLTDLDALRALLSDAGALLLNIPAGMATGFDTSYIAVGDVTIGRWTDVSIDPFRDVTLPFTVVDRPAGGSTSQRTYTDLLSFSSYRALNAAYPTYTALLAGP